MYFSEKITSYYRRDIRLWMGGCFKMCKYSGRGNEKNYPYYTVRDFFTQPEVPFWVFYSIKLHWLDRHHLIRWIKIEWRGEKKFATLFKCFFPPSVFYKYLYFFYRNLMVLYCREDTIKFYFRTYNLTIWKTDDGRKCFLW